MFCDVLYFSQIENKILILEVERENSIDSLAQTLFVPWNNKQKSVNQIYFHQER